jgi:hypothetical protein
MEIADYLPELRKQCLARPDSFATCDYWAGMSVRDRLEAIERSHCRGVSMFAARREELPSDDTGALQQYLNGN